ncbi:MAG: T9SS type A sorting domain-containing protein [candidate division KSB1 bacterium]|nr:T9SS type A sorting domain-containing protein [candidate division KSB1 bacterium]MDZ7391767.1 T9SS type A sorting domain-containing protein [candidate division KSB1 bacterium]MDZ7413972.1 T9SS type A sorting domain-containing protein [candidate division KSB1 bacterium]
MRTAFRTLMAVCVLAYSMVHAQTRIRDVQYTTDPTGASPLNGQVVTVTGIVTAEHRGDNPNNGGISNAYFFMQDAAEPWSGIQVLYNATLVAEGDSVTVTGTVNEYYGQTQIKDVTSFTRHATRRKLPPPLEVTTAQAASEAYEGCLVRVSNVTVVETDIGTYKNWKVDDGSGAVLIDTRAKYFYKPQVGAPIRSLTGIVLYGSGNFSIAPRLAWDIVEGGRFTRLQRVQQVRNSDLLLAPVNTYSDTSYAVGDTVTVRGVVTMPTGLSYAGAGVKFIMSELEGGPWSSILSYHPDSTAYPSLYEGDVIEVTGYIGEYRTGPSNMTELWITSPIDIVGIGQPLPPPDRVKTGDLRLPVTAEQWGNCMVYVKDVKVTKNNPQYELFAVDDGSGSVLVDDDSDSLRVYYLAHPRPPVGTQADSIRGWVYHHYGLYTDSTAYKLEPLYMSDIRWGSGPPVVSDVVRNLSTPRSSDPVSVSAKVTSNLGVNEVAIMYRVDTAYPLGKSSLGGYTRVVMANPSGNTYQGQIPPQPNGSFVSFFIEAKDNQGQKTLSPSDTAQQHYSYVVRDGMLRVADVQYTPWRIADSPFDGYTVSLAGVITTDSSANRVFKAYALQDAEGPWSGILVCGLPNTLSRGDMVAVTGKVTDYNPDWHYKWDNNTVLLADAYELGGSGYTINPLDVATGTLTTTGLEAEAYEGVLVRIRNATLISVNRYDVTFDDGSGPCLVDGDFMLARDQDPNNLFYVNQSGGYLVAFGDTIRPGQKVDRIQGVFLYSFGTYKIEVRDQKDFGQLVGVDPGFVPPVFTYKLEQNFPNPFNPGTKIYFELPSSQRAKVVVYNLLGQKVKTVMDETLPAGRHVVPWDGTDEFGRAVPAGVYIYRIMAGDFIAARKMVLVR